MNVIGLTVPWRWVQPKDDAELLQRLAEARDYAVPARERENLCSVAHDRLQELLAPVQKPLPSPNILVCDTCGTLPPSGRHHSWKCAFVRWLVERAEKEKA